MHEMWVRCWTLVLLVMCARGETSSGPDCSPAVRSLSSVIDRQKAEQSQRLHLEALFNRYGENGSISMAGLKRLLQSLGLDRIRTVTVQHHEKPGHHHHHHGHGHHNHHHRSDQDSHHHGDHVHHQHGDHDDSHDDHSHQHRDHQKDKNQQQDGDLGRHGEHGDHDHGDDQHDNNNEAQGQNPKKLNSDGSRVVGVAGAYDEFEKNKVPESTTTTASGARRVRREEPTIAHRLVTHTQAAGHNDIHQNHHDHDHDHDHEHDHEHDHHLDHGDEGEVRSVDHSECLNASALLFTHGLAQDGGVTLGDFGLLCPALLNQLDQGACVQHRMRPGTVTDHKHHRHQHGNHNYTENSEPVAGDTRNILTAWVGGFVSISIISLLSLLGVVLIPLMNKVFFNFLLSFLVALAVGTLSGDAFLHLIPHSQVGHHHHHTASSDGFHQDHDVHEESLDGVWKGLTALGGVYFMFLIEHFLTLGKMYKDKKNKKKAEQKEKEDAEKQTALEENLLKNNEVDAAVPAGVPEEEQVMLTPTPQLFVLSTEGYSGEDCENKCHSHFHDTVGQPDQEHHHHHDYHHILHHHHSQNHHPHSHSHSHGLARLQGAGVASLAWMVVMGDGLHNFSDGLALGAAFTESLSSGLSTTVAVFCHELPHELGDFAVLLKAGMTVKQAILYNALSAMMAYLGMATGIVIGHYAENVSMWIFALTAGLFMYVALVDMMPEMLHNDAGDHGFSHWGFFCLQNAGMLLGFGIMLLIAVFEHRIHLDLAQ